MKCSPFIGIIIVFLIFQGSISWSQELISTSGDIFSNHAVQLEWSIGEPVIDSYMQENLLLTQGFHQPEIKEKLEENQNIHVHPNPFDLFLIVEIPEPESENMFCLMADMSGKIIRIISNLKEYNEIITSEMSDGAYILRIFDSKSNLLKSIKIIKLFQL
jgi:hypothetical protein